MPADADEHAFDDGPVFDDDFVRSAAFTEPSARERAHVPGRRERWRARREERRSAPFGGELGREWGGRRSRWALFRGSRHAGYRDPGHRKAVVQVISGVMVLLLISTALWWWNRPGDAGGAAGGAALLPLPAPTPGGAPADPFAGSPAADYADGEAGLQMPDPKAVNGLSAADMALAYVQVRKLLVAANLDPAVVFERRPDAFARLLEPRQRREFERSLDRKGPKNTRAWVTSFAAGSAERAADVVKVRGTVTAQKQRDQGTDGAKVKTDHLFVYAVRRPGSPSTTMRVIVRRATEVFVHREGGRVRLRIIRTDSSTAPMACDFGDAFVHPTFPGTPGAAPPGKPVDPYDLSAPIQAAQPCQQVTHV
ncbi:SCO2583/SCO2584 N-terminal domain-containing protein [Actinomadura litoris]|uniref:SCO2583/SCO2584 N-terminal domain-containing protein n=1 Tax=Actinomadura litoris TaxID=2678616 RepID=UPI001FA6CB9F|nr:hypothetical protein [Actinomadura litoris]